MKHHIHGLNDTRPVYRFRIRRGFVDVDLTGATVTFKLRKPSGAEVSKMLTIDQPLTGAASLTFDAADVDEAGEQFGELYVTFPDAGVQHVSRAIPFYVRPEFAEVDL